MQSILAADAVERFDLSDLLPAWDDDEEVSLHAGATTLKSFELDESIVVDGDLTIEGDLASHDESGFLIVRGDLRVGTFASGGGITIVLGNLIAEHAVHTDYNHGYIHVLGDLSAKVIAAEHTLRVDGTMTGLTIDFGGFDEGVEPDLGRQQAVYDASKTFVDEVLNDQGYVSGFELSKRLVARKKILRDGRA